jgi:hypothetical protein
VDSEHAGGDVHGEDQEADDHRFYSRHGSCSFSSAVLPLRALCLCLGMLRSENRGGRVTVQRLKWTVVTCECDERDASGVRSLLLVFFIPPATALCSALVFFTHSASRAVQKASKL